MRQMPMKDLQKYIEKLGHGWRLKRFPESKSFYAVREIPVFERVISFYANLIQFDHPGWSERCLESKS